MVHVYLILLGSQKVWDGMMSTTRFDSLVQVLSMPRLLRGIYILYYFICEIPV